jgi:hypothetical protein
LAVECSPAPCALSAGIVLATVGTALAVSLGRFVVAAVMSVADRHHAVT